MLTSWACCCKGPLHWPTPPCAPSHQPARNTAAPWPTSSAAPIRCSPPCRSTRAPPPAACHPLLAAPTKNRGATSSCSIWPSLSQHLPARCSHVCSARRASRLEALSFGNCCSQTEDKIQKYKTKRNTNRNESTAQRAQGGEGLLSHLFAVPSLKDTYKFLTLESGEGRRRKEEERARKGVTGIRLGEQDSVQP